jgi:hypothetical protein
MKMKKKVRLFWARPVKPDPENLAARLVERRLARLRQQLALSSKVADWLTVETASWRMRQGEADMFNRRSDAPTLDDYPHYPSRLSSAERSRIVEWSRSWVGRMSGKHQVSAKLPKEDREALIAAAPETLAVYLTEHQVDEAFADVHKEFPWLASLTEKAWLVARRRAFSGLPTGVGAMLLSGPPGTGKSSWARAVARALGVATVQVDVGTTGGVFDLQGISKGWGSADKGRVVSTIVNERQGNPLVILDEIDAGHSNLRTTGGSVPGLFKVLMGMIEPSTAQAWTCPYYQIPIDLRHLSWICTSNNTAHMEQALLDRMKVVDVPDMTQQQLLDFVRLEAVKRFDADLVDYVVANIGETLRHGHRLSLRHAVKRLEALQIRIERPYLH